jgi:hypothetical protein
MYLMAFRIDQYKTLDVEILFHFGVRGNKIYEMYFSPVVIAVPIFAALIAVEAWYASRRDPNAYEAKDAWNNISPPFVRRKFARGGPMRGSIRRSPPSPTPIANGPIATLLPPWRGTISAPYMT